jgi:hypothetical protein
VIARSRQRAQPGASDSAALFAEIYGASPARLPESVTEALTALSRARRPRAAGGRSGEPHRWEAL